MFMDNYQWFFLNVSMPNSIYKQIQHMVHGVSVQKQVESGMSLSDEMK